MNKNKKLQAPERDQIALLLASKTSLREISRKLGRAFSSIRDEVKRNSLGGFYTAIFAQTKSEQRNKQSRRINPLKNPGIYKYVYDKLRRGWSPEEIAGRLKRKNHGETVICHETIYHYVHSKEGKKKNLYEYLVRQHKERRHWFGRHKYQRGIPDRVGIDLRPKYINSRKVFGHWEVDSVEGKAHKKGIHTFLERKTRYYRGKIIENIDSECGVKAQLDTFKTLPPQARRSATFDNGRENFNHTKLKTHLGMRTYFCDPYSAWQKGSNEHFNGVLRRYIPKKTDLTIVSQLELDSITEEMNNRPLKCLKYETPNEAFRRELKSITN